MELISIILPAFCIGIIVSLMHIPLGQEVLKRGIIFIDLAIAQIAGFGVVVAKLYLHNDFINDFITAQILAFVFALIAASFFMLIEKKVKNIQEAIIGSTYVVISSLALLLLASNPHGSEEVKDMLAGQILWVSWKQVIFSAVIYGFVLFLWFFNKNIKEKYFYFIFAIVITISVQLVGVYLVFACLIIPAIGAVKFKNKLSAAYQIAIISFLTGSVISVIYDLPTGLVITCSLAFVAFVFYQSKKFFT